MLAASARSLGLDIMVGCMVGTSLAMAPAVMIADGADFVDLDGPLLLAEAMVGRRVAPAARAASTTSSAVAGPNW